MFHSSNSNQSSRSIQNSHPNWSYGTVTETVIRQSHLEEASKTAFQMVIRNSYSKQSLKIAIWISHPE